MPTYCAALGCNSSGDTPGRSLCRFPMLNEATSRTLAITQARQQAWLKAINRSNFFPHQYKFARLCDLHFVSGKAAHFTDVENQDWVPSINLGYTTKPETNHYEFFNEDNHTVTELQDVGVSESGTEFTVTSGVEVASRCTQTDLMKPSKVQSKYIQTEYIRPLRASKNTQTDRIQTATISTQTDGTITGFSNEIILSYKEQIKYLEEMLADYSVRIESFAGNDLKTKFFTGISTFDTLNILYDWLQNGLPLGMKLTKFQFNVSVQTISTYFYKCLSYMFSKLKIFVYMPDREDIKRTMPLAFQKQFGRLIVIILDCFEVFSETPSNIKAAAQLWSQYKHFTTIKYLIGITPQGFISFISKGFGGRSSDKFICMKSGLFDELEVGDVVMADRGFLIEQELNSRGIEMHIPTFTKGKSQLHPLEIEDTRNIANVRIHVERVIGQLRLKFQILHQYKFPLTLITKQTPSSVNVADQIVTICCALSNLCNPIVCHVEKD